MFTERDGIEIDKLRYKIKSSSTPDSPPGTIRIFNETTLGFSIAPLCNGNPADIKQIVSDFIFELAVLVWNHKKKAHKITKDGMLAIRQSNLSTVKQYLEGLEYSPGSIDECIEILGRDLDKRIGALANAGDDDLLGQDSDASKYKALLEDETISKFRSAYRKYTELTSDQQIISSMAIVFASVNFWNQETGLDKIEIIRMNLERLKERFKFIDRQEQLGVEFQNT